MSQTQKDHPLENEDIKVMPYLVEYVNWHEHDCLELVYVAEGKGIHYINDLEYSIKQGDCFIIDFGSRHRYGTYNNEPFRIVNIIFNPEIIDKSLKNCHSFYEMMTSYLIMLRPIEQARLKYVFSGLESSIGPLIQKLCNEYFSNNHARIQMLRCLLIELIITLMRSCAKDMIPSDYHESTEYILKYVENNYMNPITLSEIVRQMGFSLPYVSKCFHNDTGQTFKEFLCNVRLKQSCRLLANTKYNISHIAELCGFLDVKWYNLKFKQAFGSTPSQYRASKQ